MPGSFTASVTIGATAVAPIQLGHGVDNPGQGRITATVAHKGLALELECAAGTVRLTPRPVKRWARTPPIEALREC